MTLRLRTLTRDEHLAFIKGKPSVSFLQCPSWGDVKSEWRSESIGWIDETGSVVGAAEVLYRQLPKIKRYLAYMPEGPVIDWYDGNLSRWLDPMLAHLKSQGAFSVKMGPPVVVNRWESETIKKAIAAKSARRLRDLTPDQTDERAADVGRQLRRLGWLQDESGGAGFGDVQPRYVFQVPLMRRSLDDVHSGFNQLWRRNIKKAAKAGVEVVQGGREDLKTFHEVYKVTAVRDHFTPRPLPYFERMWDVLNAEDPERMRLYRTLAERETGALYPGRTSLETVIGWRKFPRRSPS